MQTTQEIIAARQRENEQKTLLGGIGTMMQQVKPPVVENTIQHQHIFENDDLGKLLVGLEMIRRSIESLAQTQPETPNFSPIEKKMDSMVKAIQAIKQPAPIVNVPKPEKVEFPLDKLSELITQKPEIDIDEEPERTDFERNKLGYITKVIEKYSDRTVVTTLSRAGAKIYSTETKVER